MLEEQQNQNQILENFHISIIKSPSVTVVTHHKTPIIHFDALSLFAGLQLQHVFITNTAHLLLFSSGFF